LIAALIFWLSALLSLNIGIRFPPDDGCKSSLRLGHLATSSRISPRRAASSRVPATANPRKRLAPI
jgi:hypothetical protein